MMDPFTIIANLTWSCVSATSPALKHPFHAKVFPTRETFNEYFNLANDSSWRC
jgi:hypothetical protein